VCARVFEKGGTSFPRIEAPIPSGNITVNTYTHPKHKKKTASCALHAHPVYPMCTLHAYLAPSLINLNHIYFVFPYPACYISAGIFDRDPLCAPITHTHTFTSSSLHFASSASSSFRLGGGGCARTRRG
jgi:hypothetical protein